MRRPPGSLRRTLWASLPAVTALLAVHVAQAADDGSAPASAVVAASAPTGRRADPAKDAHVTTLLGQQTAAARRIAAVQLGHVQSRLQLLHGDDAACNRPSAPPSRPAPAADSAKGPATTPGAARASLPLASCQRDAVSTIWTAGSLDVGAGDAKTGGNGFGLHTSGVMLGADRRIGHEWAVGVGFGLAHRPADLASDGTSNAADAVGATAYLSYRPSKSAFVDAAAGRGDLAMRTSRRIDVRGRIAGSRRASEQFVALAAGYRLGADAAALAPYTRLEAVRATLRGFADGDAAEALRFERQVLPALKAAVGVEGSSRIETRYGRLSPRARLEWRRELERSGSAALAYADDPGAPTYAVDASGAASSSRSLDVGATLGLRDNWSIGVGYALDQSGNASLGRFDLKVSWQAR